MFLIFDTELYFEFIPEDFKSIFIYALYFFYYKIIIYKFIYLFLLLFLFFFWNPGILFIFLNFYCYSISYLPFLPIPPFNPSRTHLRSPPPPSPLILSMYPL